MSDTIPFDLYFNPETCKDLKELGEKSINIKPKASMAVLEKYWDTAKTMPTFEEALSAHVGKAYADGFLTVVEVDGEPEFVVKK